MSTEKSSSSDDFFSNKKQENKKIIIIAFSIISIFFVFIGFKQLSQGINSPFAIFTEKNSSDDSAENEALIIYRLQNIDTDGDGLSDYDEIYIYGTSPYLVDTDSDGISDYDEVMRGTDPLCPEGQDCYNSDYFVFEPEQDLIQEDEESLDLIEGIISGKTDIAILRELLLNNGFNESDLNEISDEDLQEAYFEAVSEHLAN